MSDYKPHSLRVQRRKGERLKPCECWVGDGRWGDPFATAAQFDRVLRQILEYPHTVTEPITIEQFTHMNKIAEDIRKLRGFKLACDCPIMKDGRYVQCHADILIMHANGLTREQVRDANIRRAERD